MPNFHLTSSELQKFSTPANRRYGQDIVKHGEIDFVSRSSSSLTAKVKPRWGERRTVTVTKIKDGVEAKCSCYSKDGLCKHAVAALMAAK